MFTTTWAQIDQITHTESWPKEVGQSQFLFAYFVAKIRVQPQNVNPIKTFNSQPLTSAKSTNKLWTRLTHRYGIQVLYFRGAQSVQRTLSLCRCRIRCSRWMQLDWRLPATDKRASIRRKEDGGRMPFSVFYMRAPKIVMKILFINFVLISFGYFQSVSVMENMEKNPKINCQLDFIVGRLMMLMATLFGEIVGKYLCKFFFLLLFVFCCTKIAPRMCVCEENEIAQKLAIWLMKIWWNIFAINIRMKSTPPPQFIDYNTAERTNPRQ